MEKLENRDLGIHACVYPPILHNVHYNVEIIFEPVHSTYRMGFIRVVAHCSKITLVEFGRKRDY